MNTTCTRSHDLPESLEIQKIVATRLEGAVNILKLLLEYPSEICTKYFPAVANVFAHHQAEKPLKDIIKATKKLVPFPGYDFIFNALTNNGWTRADAINLVFEASGAASGTPNDLEKISKSKAITRDDLIKLVVMMQTSKPFDKTNEEVPVQ